MEKTNLKYSVIVPLLNEDKNVRLLCACIKTVMDTFNQPYEVIFVDDGSTDETVSELRRFLMPFFKVIVLSKHYGQSIALQAGFTVSTGTILITLDGDLQNNPQDIPVLLKKLEQGYDVVCGWRFERKDSLLKKISSRLAYFFRRYVLDDAVHDVGCTLRVFSRKTIQGVFLSNGMHRFFTVIMGRLGYRITELKVRHNRRCFCKSKYSLHNRILGSLILAVKFTFIDTRKLVGIEPRYTIKEVIAG